VNAWNTVLAQHGLRDSECRRYFWRRSDCGARRNAFLLIAGGALRAVSPERSERPRRPLCFAMPRIAADTLMFLLGRYTGLVAVGILCRISLNPESCIFDRRIPSTAVVARC